MPERKQGKGRKTTQKREGLSTKIFGHSNLQFMRPYRNFFFLFRGKLISMRLETHPGPCLFTVCCYNISRSLILSKYVYPCALHRNACSLSTRLHCYAKGNGVMTSLRLDHHHNTPFRHVFGSKRCDGYLQMASPFAY